MKPVDGATGVPVYTTVSATFDEPLTSATLALADGTGKAVKGASACNSPCTTVTFVPATRLRKGTTYTAKASGTSGAGSGSATWRFTTTN